MTSGTAIETAHSGDGGRSATCAPRRGSAYFEAELTAFPNGEHDDLVDAAVYGSDLGGIQFYFTSANR
ncbi:MAG: hypothetical protein ABSA21_13280 [Candidatus Limnocylindrales bacterium]